MIWILMGLVGLMRRIGLMGPMGPIGLMGPRGLGSVIKFWQGSLRLVPVRILPMGLVLVGLLVGGQVCSADPLEDLLEATFRIADREHSGTCFLISPKTPDPAHPRRVILATAAHVLEQMVEHQCELVLRTQALDLTFVRKPTMIPLREGDRRLWVRHPTIDLATLVVDLPEGVVFKPIPFDQVADENRLNDRTVRVGRETWVPCYPAKLEANDAGWAVLRKGSIASHPLIPLKSTPTMMVDYPAFGGDSGAPVAMIVNDRVFVVGIVLGMHRQTDRAVLPFEEITIHTPLGLAIAAQAPLLLNTIELLSQK